LQRSEIRGQRSVGREPHGLAPMPCTIYSVYRTGGLGRDGWPDLRRAGKNMGV
jgi:hypothetical protein